MRYWVTRYARADAATDYDGQVEAKAACACAVTSFFEMKLYQLEEEEKRGKEAMEAAIKSWGEAEPCCNDDKTARCICYDDYECKTCAAACAAKEAESK